MTVTDLVLGYDLGSSSVKAALFDANGGIHASTRVTYRTMFPQPGHAEQDPRDWWRAMQAATRELLEPQPQFSERIACIGIAAQMCGTIPVDSNGEPLHRCLTWMDTRSAPIARAITSGGPRIGGYGVLRLPGWLRLANGAPNLSGKDPLSKILWFREATPDIWRRAARFLDVKDWLLHRCTGEFTTTADTAQLTWLMDNRLGRRSWSDRYLKRFQIAWEKLPAIVDATAVAGVLTPAAAADLGLSAGLPVSGGVGDVNASALAAGSREEGDYHICIGTSLCLGAHSMRRRVNPLSAIGTLCSAHADRYLLVATQESAGAALDWAASAFGFGAGGAGVRALDAAASTVTPGADMPTFAPWLCGERVPVDDARLRGGLAGFSVRTRRSDLAYAVLAGVCLNARWALREAERCLKSSDEVVRVLGGGATSRVFMQVLSDMLQRPLRIMDSPEYGGARGAAMTAAVAAGWFVSLADAACMAKPAALIEPDGARRTWAGEHYAQLLGYWRATRRWHAQRAM